MTRSGDDPVLRASFHPSRLLLPTDAEVDAALQRANARRTSQASRTVATVMVLTALLASALYTVPTTRAALDDLANAFAPWAAGDNEHAPGRTLEPDDNAPRWVRDEGGRLIAKADGVGLYVTRRRSPFGATMIDFALGDGTGIGDSVEGWRRRFQDHSLIVLGPALAANGLRLTDDGRLPLLGVTAKSVDHVALYYKTGPETVAPSHDGGFVLLAETARDIDALAAIDANGREIERTDLSELDVPTR